MILGILFIGLVGFVVIITLDFLNKKNTIWEHPKNRKYLSELPGLNCGACGHTSCLSYSSSLNEENFDLCTPGGEETLTKLKKAMSIEEPEEKPIEKKEEPKKEENEEQNQEKTD